MKRLVFVLILKFLVGGMKSFKPSTGTSSPSQPKVPKSQASNFTEEESVLVDLLKNLADSKEEDSRTFLDPFEIVVSSSMQKESLSDPTLFVEGLLKALNLTCDQINSYIPNSEFETWVEKVDKGSGRVYEGHIKWTIDKVTNEVYPICIDLLTDGFIFNAVTRSFMITTRVQPSNEK